MNKIITITIAFALLLTPVFSAHTAGATFTDARIILGNSSFSNGDRNRLTNTPANNANSGQGAAAVTAGNLNLGASAFGVNLGAGVGLNDIPATGIEVNAFTLSFFTLILILSLLIARGVYTVHIEEEKNRSLKHAFALRA